MPRKHSSLAGKVLVSHPLQRDENFCESVVMIHEHSEEEGAMGFIINRSCDKKLGETQSEFSHTPLASLAINWGGPVALDRMALGGWKFPSRGPVVVRYGISKEDAGDLIINKNFQISAFVGYAGWSPGQLENEIKLNAWVVCPFEREFAHVQGKELWKALLTKHRPDLRLTLESPPNPSLN
jgi:putative transcriptional regulator